MDPSASPKVIKLLVADNSLLIYNTTEDCYNYWNNAEQEWKSLCGALGKSQFTINCSGVKVNGTYIQGKELTSSNFITVPVTVTKPGEYSIMISTNNGYNFFISGTFLSTGTYTVQVPGQGTPTAIQTDNLSFTTNGDNVTCAATIKVLSPSGTYTISCGSAIVNGVYKVGTALSATNTITLPVNVTTTGSYSITTNTVDGISFSGSGTFTGTGNQNVTLYGNGTPSSTTVKTLTITSDSQGGVSTTCSVRVVVVISGKKIIGIGSNTGTYGYYMEGSGSKALYEAEVNFGTSGSSTFKYDHSTATYNGYTTAAAGSTAADDTTFTSYLETKPDIVIIGYYVSWTTAKANAMINYLNNKGVAIIFQQDPISFSVFLNQLYGSNNITYPVDLGAAGNIYQFTSVNDKILNGPFGDIRNKNWGGDASVETRAINLPSGNITVYSTASLVNANNTATNTGVTIFRDNSLSLIVVADGGFISNNNTNIGPTYLTYNQYCPFAIDSNYKPIGRNAYGYTGYNWTQGQAPVYNSVFFANALAWAINQAEFNGINTH